MGVFRAISFNMLKIKDTLLTLPKTKNFLILSCLPFCSLKRILASNFSLIMLGLLTQHLGGLDLNNHEPQSFDFCIEW